MKKLFRLLIVTVLTGWAANAFANCTTPAGVAGSVAYSSNFGTMAFCDGTNWVSMSGGTNVTVGGTVNNPAGNDSELQFKSGTGFGSSSGLTWNNATSTLAATNIAGTLTTAAQPNITSIGTLTGLTVNGTISTTALYVNGVAITGNASGDRITSGTATAIANQSTGYISLTTGATTWGYLGSSATYLPNLNAAQVSTTNVNATNGIFNPTAVATIAGGGGNYIVSGTTQVSTSSAGSITFITAGIQRVGIDSSGNIGIGTSTPAYPLTVRTAGTMAASFIGTSTGSSGLIHIENTNATTSWNLGVETGSGWASGPVGSLYFDRHSVGPQVTITPAGRVGIGQANPNAVLQVDGLDDLQLLNHLGGSTSNYYTKYAVGGTVIGSVTSGGGWTSVAFNTTSDRRLKENIVETRRGLEQLSQIKVEDFNFKADPSKTIVQGFIAQDLYKVYPEAVTVGGPDAKKKPWSVDYGRLTPLLVKSVQDLKAENDDLRAQLQELKQQVKALQNK